MLYFISFLCSTNSYCQTDSSNTYKNKLLCGIEIGPATGLFFLTGNAKQQVNEGWCYANVGITLTYNRFQLMLQTGGITTTIKENLVYGQDWIKDYKIGSVNFQSSLGYQVVCNKSINVIPFITGGCKNFKAWDDKTNEGPGETKYTFTYALGSTIDYKIYAPHFGYGLVYFYLRILTGIYPNYFENPLKTNGNLYFINLSIGGVFKSY